MSYKPRSRRWRSSVQNVANQLARLCVGWQVVNDGNVFSGQPQSGTIVIDAGTGVTEINGKRVTMGIGLWAVDWLSQETKRLGFDDKWWTVAEVRLDYEITDPGGMRFTITEAGWSKYPIGLNLQASTRVVAEGEEFKASAENSQLAYQS